MLVVFRMAEVGKVLGFDERIGRQRVTLTIRLKLPVRVEVAAQQEQL